MALLLAVATLDIVAARATSESPAQGCSSSDTVQVVAAPAVAPSLEKAASRWAQTSHPDQTCIDVQVTSQASADAVSDLARPGVDPPDIWVPDSSEWLQKLRRETADKVTPVQSLWVSPAIASSPLVLAASPKDARALVHTAAGGWSKVLSGQTRFTIADPTTLTAGLLTLAAAQDSLGSASGTPTRALVSSLVGLSTDVVDDMSGALEGPPSRPVAVSEQEVIQANAGSDEGQIQAVYPRDVGWSLDFPVVEFASPVRTPAHGDAVAAYVGSLYQPATQVALRAEGFRDGEGSAFPSTVGFTGVAPTAVIPPLPPLADRQMTNAGRVWSAAAQRNRTLVVVDVSGSMIGAKIRFASAAVRAAVGYLPDDARMGLWAFSTRLNGPSPWRRLVSLGPLGAPSGAHGHREAIRTATRLLPRLAARQGSTGLYKTTWSAFRAVRAGYDPGRYNSVVLLTDGSNTAGGLSRAELLSRLRGAHSSSRPLPIFTLAIGPDADRSTLERIAAATGGAEYDVNDLGDIRDVFLDAVIKEGS